MDSSRPLTYGSAALAWGRDQARSARLLAGAVSRVGGAGGAGGARSGSGGRDAGGSAGGVDHPGRRSPAGGAGGGSGDPAAVRAGPSSARTSVSAPVGDGAAGRAAGAGSGFTQLLQDLRALLADEAGRAPVRSRGDGPAVVRGGALVGTASAPPTATMSATASPAGPFTASFASSFAAPFAAPPAVVAEAAARLVAQADTPRRAQADELAERTAMLARVTSDADDDEARVTDGVRTGRIGASADVAVSAAPRPARRTRHGDWQAAVRTTLYDGMAGAGGVPTAWRRVDAIA